MKIKELYRFDVSETSTRVNFAEICIFSDIPETKIILGTSLKQDSIKEGMDVYFDCIVNAFPPAYKVEWRKNVSCFYLVSIAILEIEKN